MNLNYVTITISISTGISSSISIRILLLQPFLSSGAHNSYSGGGAPPNETSPRIKVEHPLKEPLQGSFKGRSSALKGVSGSFYKVGLD